jgi:uncharacterized protein (DUF1800 family)
MRLRFLVTCVTVFVTLCASSASAQVANCPFNVSDATPTGAADSLRDSVVLLRYARGMRGTALVAGTGLASATVEANIAANIAKLDINGNGLFDEDDAAVISRLTFSFRSDKWFTPTLPSTNLGSNYASRITTAGIQKYVEAGCPAATMATPTADQIAASRFLIQSTFGPSMQDIVSFLALGADQTARRNAWLNSQFAMARGPKHFDYLTQRKVEYDAASKNFGSEMAREAFWKQALKNDDQLRQRVAFALSQILVVSSNGGSNDPFELAAYLDMLADNAFGNYETILKKMALSPAMGRYLSHLRNDGDSANPNENFAREILQLFSVGLFKLDAGGDIVRDGSNVPISAYDENTVKGFAKIFTGFAMDDPYCKVGDPGWGIARSPCTDAYSDVHPSWYWEPSRDDLGANFPPVLAGWARSMIAFPGRHSAKSKQLLKYAPYAGSVASCNAAIALANDATNPGLLAAPPITASVSRTKISAADANAQLDAGLKNIFCHPNVGPFIAKHLIKFFVTSNPTKDYVQFVADKFNNNGSGVRGDMKAVMTAVLTYNEATNPATQPLLTLTKFGKLREPMLRFSAILRGFNATSQNGRYVIWDGGSVEYGISQAPMQSPTVFNYYHPEFAPPGHISNANAIGPEFEITTTSSIATTQNFFGDMVSAGTYGAGSKLQQQSGILYGDDYNIGPDCDGDANARNCILSDLSELYALQGNTTQLFNYINLVLMGGTLSDADRDNLVTALNSAYPAPTLVANPTISQIDNYQNRRRDRVKGALWLAVHMPEFQIQR